MIDWLSTNTLLEIKDTLASQSVNSFEDLKALDKTQLKEVLEALKYDSQRKVFSERIKELQESTSGKETSGRCTLN